MDECIRGRPVPSVFQAHFGFEFVEESFDDKPVSQQELVQDRHQIILHVSANARDQLQPLFPEISEEFFGNVALVGQQLSLQSGNYFFQRCAIIDVARRDLHGHQFTAMVHHHMQLEAEEPAHSRMSACGQALESAIAADAWIGTHGQLGTVGDVDAGFFT